MLLQLFRFAFGLPVQLTNSPIFSHFCPPQSNFLPTPLMSYKQFKHKQAKNAHTLIKFTRGLPYSKNDKIHR